jgi:hypothetical protein
MRVTMRTERRALVPTLVGILLGYAAPAIGENLLENAELDFDVLVWNELSPQTSEFDWHTLDADACGSASGSALAQNWGIVAFSTATFYQCVPGIVAGQEYTFGAYLRFPSGQAQTGYSHVRVNFMEQADCHGEVVGLPTNSANLTSSTTDAWIWRGVDSAVAPSGANGARVSVILIKDSHTSQLDLHYDRAFFGAGHGYLFGDGFESDSTCRWDLVSP